MSKKNVYTTLNELDSSKNKYLYDLGYNLEMNNILEFDTE
jgi:hypothetical protein